MTIDKPFESIESSYEYLSLLIETVTEVAAAVDEHVALAEETDMDRRKQALLLVLYKLRSLNHHFVSGRRILNDLRRLRQVLLDDRPRVSETSVPDPAKSA